MSTGKKNIGAQELHSLVKGILVGHGVPAGDAQIVADSLTGAELMGISSHGVQRVKLYVDGLKKGGTSPVCRMEAVQDSPGVTLYDAHGALGIVAAHEAMVSAVKKARANGVAISFVRNSNHCGAMRFFTDMAAEEGMVGIASSNASSTMAPFGSREAYLGTNPVAVSLPNAGVPIVLDMATSVVARGKIIMADRLGAEIPEGWALDQNGDPTTNASAALAGCVLPFGGAKGSGIAMMADMLCGVLSGGAYGRQVNYPYATPELITGCCHLLMAVDVGKLVGLENFRTECERYRAEIKSLAPANGFDEVFMPGEIGYAKRREGEKKGVDIPYSVYDELIAMAGDLKIPREQDDL